MSEEQKMKFLFLTAVLALSLVSMSACSKKAANPTTSPSETAQDTPTSQKPGDASSTAGAASKRPPVQCPAGKSPKVYEGTCSGSWSLSKQTDGTMACVFNWGPVKECPKGAVAIGYKAVCYGSLQKPGAGSVESCSTQHGNPPSVTPYKLICCE